MLGKAILLMVGVLVAALVIAPLLCLLYAIPVYYIWNLTIPAVFGLAKVTYWQAYGLTLLGFLFFNHSSSSSSSSS